MGQGVSLLLQEHLLLAKGQKNNEKDHTSRAIYHDLFFSPKIGNDRSSTFNKILKIHLQPIFSYNSDCSYDVKIGHSYFDTSI